MKYGPLIAFGATSFALILANSSSAQRLNVRADVPSGKVILYLPNNSSSTVVFRVTRIEWNWAKVKEKLPMVISIPPKSSKAVRFTPVDPSVPLFGTTVFAAFENLDGGRVVGGGTFGPSTHSGPTVGLQRQGLSSRWDVALTCYDTPAVVQNLVVHYGSKVVHKHSGLQTIRTRLRVLAFIDDRKQPVKWSLQWRPSPWAPWFTEKGVYKIEKN